MNLGVKQTFILAFAALIIAVVYFPLPALANPFCPLAGELSVSAGKTSYLIDEPVEGEVVFRNNYQIEYNINLVVALQKDNKSILTKSSEVTLPPFEIFKPSFIEIFGTNTLAEQGDYIVSATAVSKNFLNAGDCTWVSTFALNIVGKINPRVDSIEPNPGLPSVQITISGAGFTPTGNNVQSDSSTVASNLPSTGTTLKFTLPDAPAGQYPLSVSNGNGVSNELIFTVLNSKLLSSLAITPQDYFLGQTVTGLVIIDNKSSTPITESFSIELYKDSVLFWQRQIDNVSVSSGAQTFDLDSVFGFKPTIPNEQFYNGNWRLIIKNKDSSSDTISQTFSIRSPVFQLSLFIDPKEYQLGETLKGEGAVINPAPAPVVASFKAELLQGRTSRWSRELNSIIIPSGASQFTLQDVFGAEPKIPDDSQYIGNWKLVITQIGTSTAVDAGFEIKNDLHPPIAGISINVNAARAIKDISTIKPAVNINFILEPTQLKYFLTKFNNDIGVKDRFFRLHEYFGESLLTPSDTKVVEETIKLDGKPIVLFWKIPKELGDGTADYYRKPPKSYKAWRKYVYDVVSKYKSLGVQYYEIWNEPDLDQYWLGTQSEFFSLYEATVKGMLDADPNAKIIAPAAFSLEGEINPGNGPLILNLIDFSASKGLPLHMISWHDYDDNPNTPTVENIKLLKSKLASKGFSSTQLIVDEWSPVTGISTGDVKLDTEYTSARYMAQVGQFIQSGVDYQTFYTFYYSNNDLDGFFGIFSKSGITPAKYNALRALSLMGNTLVLSTLDGEPSNLLIATKSDNSIAVAVTNPEGAAISNLQLNIKNVPPSYTQYTKYIIDGTRSNAYQAKDRILAKISQEREEALPAADKSFRDYLLAKGYSKSFIDIGAQMASKYLANPGDATVEAWFNTLTAQEQRDVKSAFAQAMAIYQPIILKAADEINNWPEVKLYSETKTVAISNEEYKETIKLEPYAVQIIILQ